MNDIKAENSNNKIGYIALLSGALTLLLFATQPYILDLIEPSKSIGQVIGENAKDLIEALKKEKSSPKPESARALWSTILTISAFVLLAFSIAFSLYVLSLDLKKIYGISGIALSLLGLTIYLTHLALGVIVLIVVAVLVVGLVLAQGS